MEELRLGLWTWTAPHPTWTPEEGGPDGWDHASDWGPLLDLQVDLLLPTHGHPVEDGRQVLARALSA